MPSPCHHYPLCGGCRLQHLDAATYETWKSDHLEQILTHEGLGDTPVAPIVITPPATRRRARLAARHEAGGVVLGFNAWRSHDIIDLAACPVLLPELERFIPALRESLPRWLPQGDSCDVQITALAEGLDIVFVGGPALGPDTRKHLTTLATALDIAQLGWRKWDSSPVELVARRRALTVRYGYTNVPFPPASFLQATQTGENALIDFARQAVGKGAKVLDLFCGLGGFGLSMAVAKAVSFVDLDGPAIASLGKIAKTPRYTVEKRNLVAKPYTANECNPFDVVIFDPPRGGAKAQAEKLAQCSVPDIVAISCDPPSFARDAKILIKGGYKLQALQPVDQFLWSTHLEMAGWFAR